MIAFLSIMDEDEDRDLLVEIYHKYGRFIYSRMMRAIPVEDAADCAQDCFVRLTANVQRLRTLNASQMTAYILRTIQSVVVDYKRKKKLLLVEFNEELLPENPITFSVESAVEEKEVYQRFLNGFYTLSETDQLILRSLYQENLSREELAKLLGIRPSSIRTYISRAKKRALKLMRGELQ